MMKLFKAVLILAFLAALVAAGFGYGRWYSTRPDDEDHLPPAALLPGCHASLVKVR